MAKKKIVFLSYLVLISALWPWQSLAEFVLDFQPDNTGVFVTGGGHAGASTTPWLVTSPTSYTIEPERVIDPDNGKEYLHIVMGSLSDGMIQDVYIERTGSNCFSGWLINPCNWRGAYVGDLSSSNSGNGRNPLSNDESYTGTGTANPRKVIMRQIVEDEEMTMEFLKDRYDRKPAISQVLATSTINSVMVIDMRNSTLDDNTTPALFTNTMTLLGANLPEDPTFNMATDAELSYTTGGQWIYIDGTGAGQSNGTYDYIGGAGFDTTTVDWASFFDASDPTNSWGYEANKPE